MLLSQLLCCRTARFNFVPKMAYSTRPKELNLQAPSNLLMEVSKKIENATVIAENEGKTTQKIAKKMKDERRFDRPFPSSVEGPGSSPAIDIGLKICDDET